MLNESAAHTRASQAAPDVSPCVYFDGGCPLCSKEIALYRASSGADQLRWVDAQACDEAELGPALNRKAALARLHVRLPDGTLLSGAAAFLAIWQQLPAFRLLAWLGRVPGALLVMEAGYRAFLTIRPLWRATPSSAWPDWPALPVQLRRELRTDHAGETGAVMIYRGVLAVTRDPQVREFAQHHLRTEARHLELIETVVPRSGRSLLLPLWRVAGWLTGAIPACFGAGAVYATIESVETFVDQHYADQLRMIDTLSGEPLKPSLTALRALLADCQQDEVTHREDARTRRLGAVSFAHESPSSRHRQPRQGLQSLRLRVAVSVQGVWTALVASGSAAAVRVSRWI